jgi:hypothetical protein
MSDSKDVPILYCFSRFSQEINWFVINQRNAVSRMSKTEAYGVTVFPLRAPRLRNFLVAAKNN